MDVKELTKLRKQAEDAVKDMAAGDLKTKAFEVFLGHLLSEKGSTKVTEAKGKRRRKTPDSRVRKEGGEISRVVRELIEEGYFNDPGKRVGQVISRLSEKGYSIKRKKVGALATALTFLCRNREVNLERRKLTKEEKGKDKDDWMFFSR